MTSLHVGYFRRCRGSRSCRTSSRHGCTLRNWIMYTSGPRLRVLRISSPPWYRERLSLIRLLPFFEIGGRPKTRRPTCEIATGPGHRSPHARRQVLQRAVRVTVDSAQDRYSATTFTSTSGPRLIGVTSPIALLRPSAVPILVQSPPRSEEPPVVGIS